MARRTLRLAVVKADGTREAYLHTKVVGTIANALNTAGQADIMAAEELSEAVTFFLYQNDKKRRVSTSEIFSIIETVLASTGYEEAAVALSEYNFERRLKRCRVEVAKGQLNELADAENIFEDGNGSARSRWDKSRIVADLISEYELDRQTARAIASMVEERVFNMELCVIPTSLVRQLVLSDAAAVIRAEKQMQTI